MEHVLAVSLGGESAAYPLPALASERVVNDTVGGIAVVIFWKPGMVSGLKDAAIAGGEDIGSATAFDATVDGGAIRFRRDGERIVDETGGVWDASGRRVSPAPMKELRALPAIGQFWFSQAAFNPGTRVYRGR